MQIHVCQGISFRLGEILKAYVLEINGAVLHLSDRIGRACQSGHLIQHLHNAADGFGGDGQDYVDHGQHHQLYKDLHAVCQHSGDLAHIDEGAAAGDDQLRAHQKHEDHVEVHTDLHERAVQCHNAFRLGEIPADVFGCLAEFFLFIFLTGEALDYTHTAYVFLNGLIQPIVFLEYAAESRHSLPADEEQTCCQKRNEHDEGGGQSAAHNVRHNDGEDQHQRRPHRRADDHHIRHLHVAHVCGHTGNEGGRGEFINVLKGIALHLVEDSLTQIFGKSGGSLGAGKACDTSAREGQSRHHDEQKAGLQDQLDLCSCLDGVYQVGGNEGDERFNNRLGNDKNQRKNRGCAIFFNTAGKPFYHNCFPF